MIDQNRKLGRTLISFDAATYVALSGRTPSTAAGMRGSANVGSVTRYSSPPPLMAVLIELTMPLIGPVDQSVCWPGVKVAPRGPSAIAPSVTATVRTVTPMMLIRIL